MKRVRSISPQYYLGMESVVYLMRWMKKAFCISRTALLRCCVVKVLSLFLFVLDLELALTAEPFILSIYCLAGRQWFIRSALISSLPDDIINETVMKFADTPVGCST